MVSGAVARVVGWLGDSNVDVSPLALMEPPILQIQKRKKCQLEWQIS